MELRSAFPPPQVELDTYFSRFNVPYMPGLKLLAEEDNTVGE